jgi:hypothetical protein
MSIIQAAGSGEVSTGFYKLLLDQSLKFNDADSPYLYRTPASQGSLTTFTFSFWYKRCVFGTYQEVFHVYPGSGERSQILFMNDDTLKVELEAANVNHFRTNRLFRDPSAWYNVVVAFDSTNGTEASRVKIYVNGVDESDTANGGGGFSTANYPSQSATSGFNTTSQHEISTYDGSDYHLDGYLAEVNFIDGTALTAASFGETKNGIWIPKSTSGLTFGTNGFHLTFKDDVVSEGFNAVTYTGTGAAQSISGLGFDPDFLWIKSRSNSDPNELIDTVRGATQRLRSESTNAENTASSGDGFASFDADGFTLNSDGGGGQVNGDGRTYVAWAWEAGGAPTADNSENAGATPTAGSVKIDGSNLGSALAGSIAATRISANTARGFSIVTYTGTGSNGATVAHGLGAAPTLIFIKSRVATSADGNWLVYAKAGNVDETDYLLLNTNGQAEDAAGAFNDTAATSTVFSLGTFADLNQSGKTYVAYCWTSITGYSAIGSFTGNGGSQAIDVGFTPAFVMLRRTGGSTWGVFDNTRQSRNLQMLAWNSTAVETTNAQMNFSGNTFNDNGYLSDNGEVVIYMAFADTREAAFFKDVSGQGNNWTPVNLDYRDSVPDTPTNSFATFNPLYAFGNAGIGATTFSEGNLKAVTTSGGTGRQMSTIRPVSGKWYAEFYVADSTRFAVGIENGKKTNSTQGGNDVNSIIASYNGQYYYNGGGGSYMSSLSNGNIVQVAMDVDNKLVFIGINNTWQNSATASEIVAATATNSLGAKASATAATLFQGDMGIFTEDNSGSGAMSSIANFGQDSSFTGLVATENSNADGEGHGSFAYAPPSGFLALCSQNLPDVDIIDGSDNFNTVLYTAASSNGTYNITGNGFQPDWSWVKNRDNTERHFLFDSVRGNTSMTDKFLVSDATSTEGANGVAGTTVTVNADGMQIVESSIDSGELYFNSRTYVMWNWLAATAFSNDASATSVGTIDSEGRTNATAGFSIIKWTGTGSNGTIAHGLSAAPEFIIVKNRGETDEWPVLEMAYNGATHYLRLNSTAVSTSTSVMWNNTAPTSSVFSVGTYEYVNASGENYISYIFHSVEGYSKVGNYVGNGNANGPFVYTGFRPAWILIKDTGSANGWQLHDSKRPDYNPAEKTLDANTTAAEANSNDLDILSNGFKVRNTYGTANQNTSVYIYLAFADQPFKFSNAR